MTRKKVNCQIIRNIYLTKKLHIFIKLKGKSVEFYGKKTVRQEEGVYFTEKKNYL